MSIQDAVTTAVKAAMRARARERLGTLRLIQAAFKQFEVDKRRSLDADTALVILK